MHKSDTLRRKLIMLEYVEAQLRALRSRLLLLEIEAQALRLACIDLGACITEE